MPTTAGIVCHKTGFGCTVVADDGTVVDHEIEVPANISARGEALAWLAAEAKRIVELNGVEKLYVQKPGAGKFGGASGERHEVDGAVQIGAHHAHVACDTLNREQVRAALGVPRAKGAYESILARPEVKARSNAVRRDQYLLALAAAQ